MEVKQQHYGGVWFVYVHARQSLGVNPDRCGDNWLQKF